ncbi:MAG: head completion/stabilization protein [Oxalobacter sp.]|nr:head completion/stabilization protein [Oxalobacter sp.]
MIAIEPFEDDDPATPDLDFTVTNDGWFPDIDLKDFRNAQRLDGTVTHDRLKQAIVAAIIYVNIDLQSWQEIQNQAGHTSMKSIPATAIAGESLLVINYRRAVYCMAKADLIERYRDYDTTGEGNKKAEWLESSPDEQRRNAHWAIADITKRRHLTVEII